MSDLELIYLILAVFYLAECGQWIRPGSLVMVSQLGERPRIKDAHGSALLRNDAGGVLFGNLLPLGYSLPAQAWPLSLSPLGIASFTRQSLTPDQRPDGEKQYVPWDRVRGVQTDGRVLHVDGRLFVQAASAEQARALAALLIRLAEVANEQRETAIVEAVQRPLDAAAFAQTFRSARRRSAILMAVCTGFFFYLFAAVPCLLTWQIAPNLLGILPGYFGFVALTILVFRRAHRLLGRASAERWSSTFTMLVSPADAIHSRDRLLRPLAADYHPLAVAAALGRPNDFRALARRVVLDGYYPLPVDPAPPGAVAVAQWFHERWNAALHAFLRGTGLVPEELARPPQPESPECRSYCPRCHGQYLLAEGVCSTCGLPLQGFSAPPPPPSAPVPQVPPTPRRVSPAKKRKCRRK